jgi:hypothetical protein
MQALPHERCVIPDVRTCCFHLCVNALARAQVAAEANCHTDILLPFNEPPTRGIGAAMRELGEATGVYKMMLIDRDDARLLAVRGELEGALGATAAVTRAMPTMLEVLPPGCSKVTGVRRAAELLGLPLSEVCAALAAPPADQRPHAPSAACACGARPRARRPYRSWPWATARMTLKCSRCRPEAAPHRSRLRCLAPPRPYLAALWRRRGARFLGRPTAAGRCGRQSSPRAGVRLR